MTKDNVLIELDTTSCSSGDILLPEISQEKPRTGTVCRMGPKAVLFVRGDRVLLSKFPGTTVTVEGKKFEVVHASDILATINERVS